MESPDLTYDLVDLKTKSKAPVQINFMSWVFQEHSHCYDKRKKRIIRKIYLFLLPPLLSQDGGGGSCQPSLPAFFTAKLFEFFYR